MAKVKDTPKVQKFHKFLQDAENKYCQVKVLPERIHFTVFNIQTQKFEPPYKAPSFIQGIKRYETIH